MGNIKRYLLGLLIQFSVMLIAGYFWIENHFIKAFRLAICTTLIICVFDVIKYFYNKTRVKRIK